MLLLLLLFLQDEEAAKSVMMDFLAHADIVKISDADLEHLYGIHLDTALNNPCTVSRV